MVRRAATPPDTVGTTGSISRRVCWWVSAADAWDTWLDVIFPPRCAGCGTTGSAFCPACSVQIRPVPAPCCEGCGTPLPADCLSTRCGGCALTPSPLAGVQSAGWLEGPLRLAIHRLKYRGQTTAGRALAQLLIEPAHTLWQAGHLDESTLVVPVPLHPARLQARGYNQSALLARHLGRALRLEVATGAVQRVRDTPSQVGLGRAQRRQNLRDAFAATGTPALARRTVLLVDDVTTTGSTLANVAQACHQAGAHHISAVTLAREA